MRLSCGALKKDSFLDLHAPSASIAWQAARRGIGIQAPNHNDWYGV
jgi:hypothetical protein